MSDSLKERILEVKQWLLENPEESPYTAGKIFKVNGTTLASAKRRGTLSSKPYSGQNKILTIAQEQAIHVYIKSLLENCQLLTKELIFSAICFVRNQANQSPPSLSWYQKW